MNRERAIKAILNLKHLNPKLDKLDEDDLKKLPNEQLKNMLLELGKKEEENLETGIDWDHVMKKLEEAEPYEDVSNPGIKVKSVFLGTVFSLLPSGKYYTFWACSNLESCPLCEGEGCEFCGNLGSREAYLDQIFWEKLEAEAEEHNCTVTNSDFDPCDILVEMIV